MSAELFATSFIYLGAIGVLQFVFLAVSARQLQGVTTVYLGRRMSSHLGRRMSSPMIRHAQSLAAFAAALLLVGIVLRVYVTA